MDISDVTAPPEGGKKILLFCEKVSREDIKVGFTFSAKTLEYFSRLDFLTVSGGKVGLTLTLQKFTNSTGWLSKRPSTEMETSKIW